MLESCSCRELSRRRPKHGDPMREGWPTPCGPLPRPPCAALRRSVHRHKLPWPPLQSLGIRPHCLQKLFIKCRSRQQQEERQEVTETPETSPRAAFASRNSRSFSGGRLTRSFSSLDILGRGKNLEELENFLGQVPLFRCLPRSKLTLLAEAGQKKKYVTGAIVIQAGEEGDCFYIIQHGEAEVVKEGSEEQEDEEELLVVLSKGDFFGERALLTKDVRAATVRAGSPLSLIEISREVFESMGLREDLDFRGRNAIRVEGHQTVKTKAATPKSQADRKFILDALAGNENISQFLNVYSMPQLSSPAWREDITVGEEVIRQGDSKADFCYIIQSGEFAVIIHGKVVGHLSKGNCFGELSLLYSAPRTATIKATKNSSIWVLPRGWLKTAAQESAAHAAKKRLVFLNHAPVLDMLLQDEKRLLAPMLSECHMKQKEEIVGFGEEEASLYILIDGSARILEDDLNVIVTAGFSPSELKIHTFCEKALCGPGHASPRSVKITSPTATCYKLDGVAFAATFGSYLDIVNQSKRGFDFIGLESQTRGHSVDTSTLLSLRKKDLRKIAPLRNGQFGGLELWQQTRTGEPYMVKSVSKGYVVEQALQERVLQERDAMLLFDHPFIIKLLQTFSGEQNVYFLMETALGGDLHSVYLTNALHGSNRHALFYAACILLALEHIHSRKVAYRDLKPENVFLSSIGFVKLVNFGLAKVVNGRTYTIVGTPEYLAPEIIGAFGHNHAVDWWAFGIFIFECLSGKTPFEDTNPMQAFGKAMAGIEKIPSFPSKVNPAAERLIRALLKREPGRRLPMKGVANVKQADWFVGFDWRQLTRHEMVPPFQPSLQSNLDTGNFNKEEVLAAPSAPFVDDNSGWDRNFPIWGVQPGLANTAWAPAVSQTDQKPLQEALGSEATVKALHLSPQDSASTAWAWSSSR
eukprot:s101_g32.t3